MERLTSQSGHCSVSGAYSPPQIMQMAIASVPIIHSPLSLSVSFILHHPDSAHRDLTSVGFLPQR
jgi:hypothetical protein